METQTQSNLESNKLIAEFDGRINKLCHNNTTATPYDYHKSWDWLMPIVEKIEKMVNNVTIDQKYSLIYTGFMFNDKQDFQWQENKGSKLENTYNVVVEFILWYNENKKK